MPQGSVDTRTIYCILPPHILRNIAQNGTAAQRRIALQTLAADATIRALRVAQQAAPHRQTLRGLTAGGAEQHRTIYDAHSTTTLPGDSVRGEGAPATADPAVNEAYDGLGATFDLYAEVFDRNSIDDQGLPLLATVHYDQHYDNAFWNGQQMVFGDGDGDLFNRFTISIDVIGHELTHGVTQDTVGLDYFGQPGALNESVSDVFGSLVKQFHLQQSAAQADWLIGAGLFTAKVHGAALRSMKAPGTAFDDPVLGKDPQPAHMRDYVHTTQDNGGVHINSGIPNHAFYLIATAIGGNAWEKAGQIWYATLRDPLLRPNASFRAFARRTAANAGTLYGAGSAEQQAVIAGWGEVGVKATAPAPTAPKKLAAAVAP